MGKEAAMTFITLDEAKAYLRVDSSDEDAVIGSLLMAAGRYQNFLED